MSEQFVRWNYPGNELAGGSGLWWRRLSFGLMGLLGLVFLYNVSPWSQRMTGTARQTTTQAQKHFGDAAVDNEAVDGLKSAACRDTFPDLFSDIDRAVAYWKARDHTISESDIDISDSQMASMRILIHDNELRILESIHAIDAIYAAAGRTWGVLSMIQQALDTAIAIGETLPTIEVGLNFQDDSHPAPDETTSFWSFSRPLHNETYERLWLIPNSDFWFSFTTGSFSDAKRNAAQHNAAFASKIPKIVWRGSVEMNPELRGGLVDATQGKEWADVSSGDGSQTHSTSLKVDQFCKYAATVHTEGVTFSGRLAFLTNCKSLLFVHDLEFVTHFSHLLVKEGPKQNYVPVKRDWSDLEEKVEYYLRRPDEAEAIIANNLATFRSRYTTRAATSCYFRELIRGFSTVSFSPKTTVPLIDGAGVQRRGVSFAQIIQARHDGNFELGIEYEKGEPQHDEI